MSSTRHTFSTGAVEVMRKKPYWNAFISENIFLLFKIFTYVISEIEIFHKLLSYVLFSGACVLYPHLSAVLVQSLSHFSILVLKHYLI
jgi:hypothetical protein